MLTNLTSLYVTTTINFILLIACCIFIYLKYQYNNLGISIASGILLLLVLVMSYINITLGFKKRDDIKNDYEEKKTNELNKTDYNKALALSIMGIIILTVGILFLIGIFIKQDYYI
jgi:Ca2+/Na+ antiporter